jgi:hypothetical protein
LNPQFELEEQPDELATVVTALQEGDGRHISAMEWMEGASGEKDLLLVSKLGSACVATVPQAIEDPDVEPVPFEQIVTHDFSMLTNWAGQTPFAPCTGKLP